MGNRLCDCNKDNKTKNSDIIIEHLEERNISLFNHKFETFSKEEEIKIDVVDSYDISNNIFSTNYLKKLVKLQRKIKEFIYKKLKRVVKRISSDNKTYNSVFAERNSIKTHSIYSHDVQSMMSFQSHKISLRGFFMSKKINYKFFGQKINGLKEGFGKLIWEDGSKFYGFFKRNKAEGICFFNNCDGSEFKGYYKDSRPSGYGIYKHKNGSKFEGIWEDYYLQGIGIETWVKDGVYFQGEYFRGKKTGIGTYRFPDGSIYEGEMNKSKINGYGMIQYSDKRTYYGEWKDNLMHGYGEFIWPDKKRYFGYYKDDKKHGLGVFCWKDNIKIYIGNWEDGKQNGLGIMVYEKNNIKYGLWNDGNWTKWFKGNWEYEKYGIKNENHILLTSPRDILNIYFKDV